MEKQRGILLPIASLPGDHGIGDFGRFGYEFADLLEEAGMNLWQILPLNPVGFGNSPYQPFSSFAGEHNYINIDLLYDRGLLESRPPHFREYDGSIEYDEVTAYKEKYFKEAFTRFVPDEGYSEFILNDWAYLYAVFFTLKKQNSLRCWNEWPVEEQTVIDRLAPYRNNIPALLEKGPEIISEMCGKAGLDTNEILSGIGYELFLQYMFHEQWMKLKKYVNGKGIKIIGDIPFYPGIDSLDVWSNKDCFLMDADSKPTWVAGVPPDFFSATGQRWGNPIYDWKHLEETEFKFWIDRIKGANEMFDIIRLDHFRAFDTYWMINSTCETAIDGKWEEAPGYKFFDTLFEKLPDVQIIAEDLGELRPEVLVLRDYYNFCGMKVIQFTMDPLRKEDDLDDVEQSVLYTGTHDNQTIFGWYSGLSEDMKKAVIEELNENGFTDYEIQWKMINRALRSPARFAIITMQDVLGLDDSARINKPATLGGYNWSWKLGGLWDFRNHVSRLKYLRTLPEFEVIFRPEIIKPEEEIEEEEIEEEETEFKNEKSVISGAEVEEKEVENGKTLGAE